jgi:hypothetical protein
MLFGRMFIEDVWVERKKVRVAAMQEGKASEWVGPYLKFWCVPAQLRYPGFFAVLKVMRSGH